MAAQIYYHLPQWSFFQLAAVSILLNLIYVKEGGQMLDSLLKQEEGQGLVEYGLIIFLVAIVVIAILFLIGPRVGDIFSSITAAI